MHEVAILVVSGAVLLVVALSGRLSRAWLTEPLAITTIGVLVAALGFGPVTLSHPGVLTMLEVTLALVLFTDAARIDLRQRVAAFSWPARMLGIGLPAAILLGTAAAAWLLGAPLGVALLVGVILAPTDAALAEPVLESRRLPVRVKQALNVEAGLNDGLALPALFIAVAFIEAEEGTSVGSAIRLVLEQVGFGLAGGILAGVAGAWLISNAAARGWMNPLHQKLAAVALALVCFAAVQMVGGSGFVATFVAGAVLGHRVRPKCEYLYEFAEAEGKMLVLIAFLFIGAGPVYLFVTQGAPSEVWALALVSLFLVRPIAIWLSLLGGKLMPATIGFLGWFGPRGLATVVFFLVAVEEMALEGASAASVPVVVLTLSILLHGLTARPASQWLARRLEAAEDDEDEMAEMGDAYEHPMRNTWTQSD